MKACRKAWMMPAVLGLFLAGCGGESDGLPREAVSGTVTLDGKPMPEGNIQFVPTETSTTSIAVNPGAKITDGSYSIPRESGPVPGTYKVVIYAGASGGAANPDTKKAPGGARDKMAQQKLKPELIPTKYNAQTELTAKVEAGKTNVFNFDLKTE
jgi:hypothetical protein